MSGTGKVIAKEIRTVATGKSVYDLVGPGMDFGFYSGSDGKLGAA